MPSIVDKHGQRHQRNQDPHLALHAGHERIGGQTHPQRRDRHVHTREDQASRRDHLQVHTGQQ